MPALRRACRRAFLAVAARHHRRPIIPVITLLSRFTVRGPGRSAHRFFARLCERVNHGGFLHALFPIPQRRSTRGAAYSLQRRELVAAGYAAFTSFAERIGVVDCGRRPSRRNSCCQAMQDLHRQNLRCELLQQYVDDVRRKWHADHPVDHGRERTDTPDVRSS
jgi:hypothetical protein